MQRNNKLHKKKNKSALSSTTVTITPKESNHLRSIEGVLGEQAVLEKYNTNETFKKTIDQLIEKNLKSLHYELLHSKGKIKFYSIRINDSDRLLITYAIIDEKLYVVVVEVIPGHRYENARHNHPPSDVNNILNGFKHPCKIVFNELQKIGTEEKDKLCKNRNNRFVHTQTSNDELIIFSSEQNEAMAISSPCVVTGPPGAGKTSLAFAALLQVGIKKSEHEKSKSILFLVEGSTQSQEIKSEWEKVNPPYGKHHVIICSAKDLIKKITGKEHLNSLETEEYFADEKYFHVWLHNKKAELKPKWKAKYPNDPDKVSAFNRLIEGKEENIHVIYQELKWIAAYQQDYKTKGKNQSLFSNEIEKDGLCYIYEKYIQHLEDKKKIDIGLYTFNIEKILEIVKKLFDEIIVDETQDYAPFFIKQMIEILVYDHKVRFFMDSHQSLVDDLAKLNFILESIRLYTQEKHPYYKLPCSFRFERGVALFLRAILQAKGIVTGLDHKGQETDVKTSSIEEGKPAQWIENEEEVKTQLQKDMLDVANCVVLVAREDLINVVKAKYGDEVVVIPVVEYRGLQSNTVIMYHPLDDDILFCKAAKYFDRDTKPRETVNLPKAGQGNRQLGIPFNKFYIGSSRVRTGKLIIVQKINHPITYLAQFIKKYGGAIPYEMTQESEKQNQEKYIVSPEQLITRVDEFVKNGNIDQAKTILIKHLHKTDTELMGFFDIKLLEAFKNHNLELAQIIFVQGLKRDLTDAKDREAFLKLEKEYALTVTLSASESVIAPTETQSLQSIPTVSVKQIEQTKKATDTKNNITIKEEADKKIETLEAKLRESKKKIIELKQEAIEHEKQIKALDTTISDNIDAIHRCLVDQFQIFIDSNKQHSEYIFLILIKNALEKKNYYLAIGISCQLKDAMLTMQCIQCIVGFRKNLSIFMIKGSPYLIKNSSDYRAIVDCLEEFMRTNVTKYQNIQEFKEFQKFMLAAMHDEMMGIINACKPSESNKIHHDVVELINKKKYNAARDILTNKKNNLFLSPLLMILMFYAYSCSMRARQETFMLITESGNPDVINALLAIGFHPNFEVKNNFPLLLAAEKGMSGIVKSLLNAGANPNQASNEERITPLYISLLTHKVQNNIDVTKILLEAGANPNAVIKTDIFNSALYVAVQMKRLDYVELLLSYGANVEVKNEKGETPLLLATVSKSIEIIRILLIAGADPNVVSLEDGRSALFEAIFNEDCDAIKELLIAGADINATIRDSKATVLLIAILCAELDVVKTLLLNKDLNLDTTYSIEDLINTMQYLESDGRLKLICGKLSQDGMTAAYVAELTGNGEFEYVIKMIGNIRNIIATSKITLEQKLLFEDLINAILNKENQAKNIYEIVSVWGASKSAGREHDNLFALYENHKKISTTNNLGMFDNTQNQAEQVIMKIQNAYGEKTPNGHPVESNAYKK